MDLPENCLKPSTTTLVSYTGTPIPQHGICSLSCTFKGETKVTDFFVTEAPGPAIIGLPSLEEFEIVTLNCENSKELLRIKDTADLIRQLYIPGVFSGHWEVRRTVPHHRRPRSTASRTPTTASPVQNEGGDQTRIVGDGTARNHHSDSLDTLLYVRFAIHNLEFYEWKLGDHGWALS